MHALEIIITKNAERAGREVAHLTTDRQPGTTEWIKLAMIPDPFTPEWDAFYRGYRRGIVEG